MTQPHDLTGSDIRGSIHRMAIPAAIGFFCHTLYNMTDTFYAGYISTAAQAALTFSFPLYFILLSCCVGLGQAITARIAGVLGKQRYTWAAYFYTQGLILAIVICILIWLVLLPATRGIITLLGGSGDILNQATAYSSIIYIGSPLFLFTFSLNSALQAAGNTTAFRNSVIVSVILNIILDPILMFGWLGLPALGVAGAGLATLITQGISAAYLLTVLMRTVIVKYWRPVFMRPRPDILRQLGLQAAVPTLRMLSIGVFFFIVTAFLGRIDSDAVAAYGIALRIEQMFLLPTIGLEVALLAYAGQNISANQLRQTQNAYYLCLRYGLIYTAIGALVLITLGKYLIMFFNNDSGIIRDGYHYLLMAAAVGPLYLYINMSGAVLMGALRTLDIAVVSALRLVILPLLLFWLLAIQLDFGVIGIWVGILLANSWAAWWMHYRCLRIIKTPEN